MRKPTHQMLYTLKSIGESTCTGFGYNNNPTSKRYLHVNTVHALIKRGLLEETGTMPWNFQETTPIYRVSESGRHILGENQLPELPKDEAWKQVFSRGEKWS